MRKVSEISHALIKRNLITFMLKYKNIYILLRYHTICLNTYKANIKGTNYVS